MLKKFLIIILILIPINISAQEPTREQLEQEIIILTESLAMTTSILEEVTLDNIEAKELISRLSQNLEETTIVLQELLADNARLETENLNLRLEIEELNKYVETPFPVEDYEEQILILIARVEESNETIEDLRDQIKEDQKEIERLRNSIEELIPLVDTRTFGLGLTYNLPQGILLHGEFIIPNFPVSLIGNTGYFFEEKLITVGIGIKLDF